MLTIDFYKRFWKKSADDRGMVRFGRISSTLILLMGVLWAPVMGRWERIFVYFQECRFFMAVPIVIVFLSAVLLKRANNFTATATLLLCLPSTLLPFFLHHFDVKMNTFNIAGLQIIPVIAFHIAMAYLRPAPSRQIVEKWVWNRSMLRLPEAITAGNYPWYRRLFLWWQVLLIIYVGLYIIFW